MWMPPASAKESVVAAWRGVGGLAAHAVSGPCERVPRARLVDVRRGVAVDEQLLGERQPPAGAEVGVPGNTRVVDVGEDHGTLRG